MPRPKGSPNKNRGAFLRRMREEFGEDFDPIARLAGACVKLEKKAQSQSDWKMVVDSYDKLAQYIVPKLKSVEMDVTSDGEKLDMPSTVRLVAAEIANDVKGASSEPSDDQD
jgi:hypothetical protein